MSCVGCHISALLCVGRVLRVLIARRFPSRLCLHPNGRRVEHDGPTSSLRGGPELVKKGKGWGKNGMPGGDGGQFIEGIRGVGLR